MLHFAITENAKFSCKARFVSRILEFAVRVASTTKYSSVKCLKQAEGEYELILIIYESLVVRHMFYNVDYCVLIIVLFHLTRTFNSPSEETVPGMIRTRVINFFFPRMMRLVVIGMSLVMCLWADTYMTNPRGSNNRLF